MGRTVASRRDLVGIGGGGRPGGDDDDQRELLKGNLGEHRDQPGRAARSRRGPSAARTAPRCCGWRTPSRSTRPSTARTWWPSSRAPRDRSSTGGPTATTSSSRPWRTLQRWSMPTEAHETVAVPCLPPTANTRSTRRPRPPSPAGLTPAPLTSTVRWPAGRRRGRAGAPCRRAAGTGRHAGCQPRR